MLSPLVLPFFVLQMVGLLFDISLLLVVLISRDRSLDSTAVNLLLTAGVLQPIVLNLTRFSPFRAWDRSPVRSVCIAEDALAMSLQITVAAAMLALLLKFAVSLFTASHKPSLVKHPFFRVTLVALPYLLWLPTFAVCIALDALDTQGTLERAGGLVCQLVHPRLSLAFASCTLALFSAGLLLLPIIAFFLIRKYFDARHLPSFAKRDLARHPVGDWLLVRMIAATLFGIACFAGAVLLVLEEHLEVWYLLQATAPILLFILLGLDSDHLPRRPQDPDWLHSDLGAFKSSAPSTLRRSAPPPPPLKVRTIPLPEEKDLPQDHETPRSAAFSAATTDRSLLKPSPTSFLSLDTSSLMGSTDLKRVMRGVADVETYARESPSGLDDSLYHFPSMAYIHATTSWLDVQDAPAAPSTRRPGKVALRPLTPTFL